MPANSKSLPARVLRKLIRSVKGTSRVGKATMAAVLLGAALVLVQLLANHQWFAAVAVLPLGGVLLVNSIKIHRTGLRLSQTSQLVRRLLDRGPGAGGAGAGTVATGSAGSTHTREALRVIGAVELQNVASGAAGRQAAAVATDEARPFKLFAATHGLGSALDPEADGGRRCIAVVGSPALTAALEADHRVVSLHPSLVKAELEFALPSTVVVEEEHLETGVWAGALEPHGSALLSDLLGAAEWAREHGVNFLVLPRPGIGRVAAGGLRSRASAVLDAPATNEDSAELPWGDDVAPGIFELLRDYQTTAAK